MGLKTSGFTSIEAFEEAVKRANPALKLLHAHEAVLDLNGKEVIDDLTGEPKILNLGQVRVLYISDHNFELALFCIVGGGSIYSYYH